MAQMERNVNLEEIDADALFGIDALKGQSLLQKLIFFGCLSAGILINVCLPMFLKVPRAVCVLLFGSYNGEKDRSHFCRHCLWL